METSEKRRMTAEECEKIMKDDECIQEFLKGYNKGKEECMKKFNKENGCLEQYIEGYKYGFGEGYKSAIDDYKNFVKSNGSEDGAKPRPWWVFW